MFAKVNLKVSQCQEAEPICVEDKECPLHVCCFNHSFLDSFKHAVRLHFLVELWLDLQIGCYNIMAWHHLNMRHRDSREWIFVLLDFFFKNNIIIGVGWPESLNELLLCYVVGVFWVESFQENFYLLVCKTKVKPDDCVLKFWDRDSFWVIRVNHAEALVDCDVFLHQILTNLFEDSSLPFYCILRF